MNENLKIRLKRYLPNFIKRLANRLNMYPGFIPAQGKINWGDFKSVKPFSDEFGFDRGGKGGDLPSEHFDCIILTQTLHLIFDYTSALKHCYRILKKDGILLITTPGISPIDRGEWGKYWLWSFN